jgi:hypothetical protein
MAKAATMDSSNMYKDSPASYRDDCNLQGQLRQLEWQLLHLQGQFIQL